MILTAPGITVTTWRFALPAFALVLSAFLGMYRDTVGAIVGIWARSDTFAHGFLIVPIVLWLVWRRRQTLSEMRPVPGLWAGVLLAVAGFAWLLGELAAVNALSQLALVSMLVLLVPTMLGYRVALTICFPLGFLFFGAPFGEFAMPQLMQWTADFTVLALRATGIPVYREGLQFVIPSGSWSVIEACSGIRYIIASLTVGTLYAYLTYQTTRRRVLFVVLSLLVPVMANWARAYMIVMLGHLSGNKLAVGVDHLIYGWVFFGIVIMLMFWIGARWTEPEPPHIAAHSASPSATAQSTTSASGRWLWASLLVVVVVALPHAARWEIRHARAGLPTPTLLASEELASGWVKVAGQPTLWQPFFQNPSIQLHTHYRNAGSTVGLYVGYYRNQNADRKLVSSDNVLVRSNDPQWAQVARGNHTVQLSSAPLALRTAELRGSFVPGQSGAERLTVWQFYWINGALTASDTLAKAYTAFYSLLGRGDDSAVIIVYAPKGEPGQGGAGRDEAVLNAFLQANSAAIITWLQATQQ